MMGSGLLGGRASDLAFPGRAWERDCHGMSLDWLIGLGGRASNLAFPGRAWERVKPL